MEFQAPLPRIGLEVAVTTQTCCHLGSTLPEDRLLLLAQGGYF